MPRNYQNGKIYTIRSRSRPDLIYVGSTIQSLSTRFGEHKKPANSYTSKQIITLGDSYIELLETYPCSNVEELRLRENHHMRSMDCVNKMLAINDCPHGKERCLCKICHGSCICEHNKVRNRCKICHGSGICEHNKLRQNCKLCHGSSICEHDRERKHCKNCHGVSICEHDLRRYHCKICSPIECDFCNFITSKGTFAQHLKSQKHKDNYEAELLRVSEIEITDAAGH